MSDDKIDMLINDATVGMDQLASFDAVGNPGPGVTLEIALAEVKRLTNEWHDKDEICRRLSTEHGVMRDVLEGIAGMGDPDFPADDWEAEAGRSMKMYMQMRSAAQWALDTVSGKPAKDDEL